MPRRQRSPPPAAGSTPVPTAPLGGKQRGRLPEPVGRCWGPVRRTIPDPGAVSPTPGPSWSAPEPQPITPPAIGPDQIAHLAIRRRDRLGDIIHEYQHAA